MWDGTNRGMCVILYLHLEGDDVQLQTSSKHCHYYRIIYVWHCQPYGHQEIAPDLAPDHVHSTDHRTDW